MDKRYVERAKRRNAYGAQSELQNDLCFGCVGVDYNPFADQKNDVHEKDGC